MKYKAVRFNSEEVGLIFDGVKTTFRIPLKEQNVLGSEIAADGSIVAITGGMNGCPVSPPYHVGEILYVKETWAKEFGVYWYRAGLLSEELNQIPGMIAHTQWHSSMQMPYEAARIFLKVMDVQLQRLQDITLSEVECEGIWPFGSLFPIDTYSECWNKSMSAKKRQLYGWDKNPWVFVISFERISKNEALQQIA